MQKNYAVLIYFFLITSYVGSSQEYKFQHITTVDGLSHNEVRRIVKDSQGKLQIPQKMKFLFRKSSRY